MGTHMPQYACGDQGTVWGSCYSIHHAVPGQSPDLAPGAITTELPQQLVFNCFRSHIGKRTSHLLATTLQHSPWIWGLHVREGPQSTTESATRRLLPQQLCVTGSKTIPWLLAALEEIPLSQVLF